MDAIRSLFAPSLSTRMIRAPPLRRGTRAGDDDAVRGNRCGCCGGAVVVHSGLRRGPGAGAVLHARHAANLERDLGGHHLHDDVQLDRGAVPDDVRRSRRERRIDRGANDIDTGDRERLDRLVLPTRLHDGTDQLPECLLAKVAFALR